MIMNPAFDRLLGMDVERVEIGGEWLYIIPNGEFSTKEIEELRDVDEYFKEYNKHPMIANFLPDDVRPSNIPKL